MTDAASEEPPLKALASGVARHLARKLMKFELKLSGTYDYII